MAYAEPDNVSAGETTSASKYNQLVTAIKEIWKGAAAGDVDYYTGATAKARLAIAADKILAGNAAGDAPAYRAGKILHSETTLAGAANEIIISSIPATFNHLQVILVGRSSKAATTDFLSMQLNADGGSNYDGQYTLNDADAGSTISGGVAGTSRVIGQLPGANAPANSAGHTIIDIPLYRSAFYKTWAFAGHLKFGTTTAGIRTVTGSGTWKSTDAITSVRLFLSADNLIIGSYMAIYGY